MKTDTVKFNGAVRKVGGSYYLLLRPELVDYLNIDEGDEMNVMPENGQHGPYISAWNPDQQNDG